MIFSSVLDTQTIDEQQVQSFFSRLTLEKLLYAAVLLVLCAVLIRLILRAADKLFSRSKLDHTIFGFLRTSAKAILIFITIMLVAGTLGVDTTSLLAILSVAGLAVSLSLQTALSNVAGAMMILTAKPFRAGDYVQIGDKAGTVLTIGAVYTSLRTYDGQRIYLPNSQVTAAAIVNQTAEPARRIDLNVSASYDDAADTVRAVLTQAAAAHEKVLKDRPIEAHVTGYGDSAVNYVLRFWARTEDYWTCYNDVLDGLQAAFSSAGITMTYPHINVHMEAQKKEYQNIVYHFVHKVRIVCFLSTVLTFCFWFLFRFCRISAFADNPPPGFGSVDFPAGA